MLLTQSRLESCAKDTRMHTVLFYYNHHWYPWLCSQLLQVVAVVSLLQCQM